MDEKGMNKEGKGKRHEAIELNGTDAGSEDWLDRSSSSLPAEAAGNAGRDFANWDGDLDVEMPVRKAAPDPLPPPPSASEPASLRERILAWQSEGLEREQIVTRLQAEGMTPQAARLEVRRALNPVPAATSATKSPGTSGSARVALPSRPAPISPDRPTQMTAYLFAAGAAVVGALAWGGLMYLTDREWGLLAWGLGGLCGTAVVLAPGSIRGRHLQIAATASCLSGILAGKILGLIFFIAALSGNVEQAADAVEYGRPSETDAAEELQRENNPLHYTDQEMAEWRKEFENGGLEDLSKVEGMEDYPNYKDYSDFMDYAWAVDAYDKKKEAEYSGAAIENPALDEPPQSLFWMVFWSLFGFMDIIFIILAVSTAWRIPKAVDLPTEVAA